MTTGVNMLIIARDNVHEKLDDKEYNVAFLVPNQSYEVIGIEYGYFRVVLDNLDAAMVHPIYCDVRNYESVNSWVQEISDEMFHFTPKEFAQHPYFFEQFHDGHLEFVNVYMHYLGKLLSISFVKDKVYNLYLEAIKDKHFILSYWMKEWMKSLFGVEKAIDLRQFSEIEWEQKLSGFFGE